MLINFLFALSKSSVDVVVDLFCDFGMRLKDGASHCVEEFENSCMNRKTFLHDFVQRLQRVVGPELGAEGWQTFGPDFLDPEVLGVRVQFEQCLAGVRDCDAVRDASANFEELQDDLINRKMRQGKEELVDVVDIQVCFDDWLNESSVLKKNVKIFRNN